MTVDLSNEEKSVIILQHLKNIAYLEYNAILTLAQEQALSEPNEKNIQTLTDQVSNILAQKQVLQEELDSLA
jgi:hypothetical protein